MAGNYELVFPKGKDDIRKGYGIYVMPREVANIDTEKIDNAPQIR